MPFPPVDFFTLPDNPACDRLREYLVRETVSFTEYNVREDSMAAARVIWITGRLWVPTLLVENEAIIGFDRTKLDELFEDIRERLRQEGESI